MVKAITAKTGYWVWIVPLLIISTLVLLAKSPVFYSHPDALSIGITLDFLITLPLVFYLLIRKKNISWLVVSPVATAGIIIAGLVIPKDHQQFLVQTRSIAFTLMELAVISFFIIKIRKAKKIYNLQKHVSFDFYTALKKAVAEVVPKSISDILSTEIAVFYYSLFSWRKRELKPNEFTCHKENGSIALLSVIIFIVFVETVVQHILISMLSPTVAWIITAISIYSIFVLFGVIKSLLQRPVIITGDKINLRYGILSETVVPFDNIESVKFSPGVNEINKKTVFLSPLHKIENINVVINLSEESLLTVFYGRKKRVKSFAFYIDDLARFREIINKQIVC